MPKPVEWYFELKEEYTAKHGPKTVILMEVGGFYEIYGLKHDKIYMEELAATLKMLLSQKNKAKGNPISEKDPYMIGFPDYVLERHFGNLLDAGYTVVRVDQLNSGVKDIQREVAGVYTKGTYIDSPTNEESMSLMSIYINALPKRIIYSLAVIDLSIGKTTLYEKSSDEVFKNNIRVFPDNIIQYIETFNPVEVLISDNNGEIELPLSKSVKVVYKKFNSKIGYQNKLLKKIFGDTGMLSPIEYIGIECYPDLSSSYCTLLNHAYSYDKSLIRRLTKPIIWNNEGKLLLNNNSLLQLNAISHEKDKNLLVLLNRATTNMGKRLFKYRLLNPITDETELNRRYDAVEVMKDKWEEVENKLKNISDLERIHRKISLKRIKPFELALAHISYDECLNLMKLYPLEKSLKKEFIKFLADFKQTFNIEELSKRTKLNKAGQKEHFNGAIFNKGISPVIDTLNKKLRKAYARLTEIETEINQQFERNNDMCYLKKDGDYYHFELTAVRYNRIKKYLRDQNYKAGRKSGGTNSKYMMTNDETNKLSRVIAKCTDKMDEETSKVFRELLEYLDRDCLFQISEWVAEIDVIKTNCKNALQYGYCRPTIIPQEGKCSYIKALDSRHPIVERILTDTTYVPNDIDTGKQLLYGVNSSGKSCYMKTIGLLTVMSQSGMYVPATSYEYKPFQKLFTRITGDDNIYLGESSFTREMKELNEILNNMNEYSLVLGDELTKGTANTDAIKIMDKTLYMLIKYNVTFIFATHLHELLEYNIDGIHICHMSTEIAKEIKFDRKLKNGPGCTDYGVAIANHLISNKEFKELLRSNDVLLTEKTSRYSPDVYVDECQVCGTTEDLHVHHIKFQKDCNEYGLNYHIKKNAPGNLCVLCERHHHDVHDSRQLIINGYVSTSNGVKLDYSFVVDEV